MCLVVSTSEFSWHHLFHMNSTKIMDCQYLPSTLLERLLCGNLLLFLFSKIHNYRSELFFPLMAPDILGLRELWFNGEDNGKTTELLNHIIPIGSWLHCPIPSSVSWTQKRGLPPFSVEVKKKKANPGPASPTYLCTQHKVLPTHQRLSGVPSSSSTNF